MADIAITELTTSTTGFTGFSAPISISVTVSSYTNGLLLVGIGSRETNDLTSIAFNGDSLTEAQTDGQLNDGVTGATWWYLKAPDVGTFNLVINSSEDNEHDIWIGLAENVDQTTPVEVVGGSNTFDSTANTAITTLTNGAVVIGVAHTQNSSTVTALPGITVEYNNDPASGTLGNTVVGWKRSQLASNVSTAYTLSSGDNYAQLLLAIKPDTPATDDNLMKSPLDSAGTTAPSASATRYAFIAGPASWQTSSTSELVEVPADMWLSDVTFTVLTAPGAGKSWTLRCIRNFISTTLTTVISDTNTTATSTGKLFFNQGDTIEWQLVPSGTPTLPGGLQTITAVMECTGQPIFGRATGSGADFATGIFGGSLSGTSPTASDRMSNLIAAPGNLSNFYARVALTPTTSWTATLYTGTSTASAMTTTITSPALANSDLVNTVAVSAGSRVRVFWDATDGLNTTNLVSMLFTPTTLGDAILSTSRAFMPSTSATNYQRPVGMIDLTAVEADQTARIGNWTVKKFLARTATASGAGTQYDATVRHNGADTGLTVALANTTTFQSVSTDVAMVASDLVSFKWIPTNTPVASFINVGMLLNETITTPPPNSTAGSVSMLMGI